MTDGWWLLECGHYGKADKDFLLTRDDELFCRTCTPPVGGKTAYRRMVQAVRDLGGETQ